MTIIVSLVEGQKVMVQCVAPTVAMETNMREFSHVFMW